METRQRIAPQNVAKRLPKSGAALVAKLKGLDADVIALQEVTLNQVEGWCSLLSNAGYNNVVRGIGYAARGGALLASRRPILPVQLHTSIAAGRRVAAGSVGGMGVASVYFPTGGGTNGWSSLYDDLMLNPTTQDFILIGDFQMAVSEVEISSGTFARWRRDRSFLSMQNMLLHWRDAFRTVHGAERIAYSHRHNSGARWLNDHAFVPPSLQILNCEIDWSPIDDSLSDHATLFVDIDR